MTNGREESDAAFFSDVGQGRLNAEAGAGRQCGIGIDQTADQLSVQAGDEHEGRGRDREKIGQRRFLRVGQGGARHGAQPDQLGYGDRDHLQRHEQQMGDQPE